MPPGQTKPIWVTFGRPIWLMLGPLALVLLTFHIVSSGGGWLTGADVGYFVVLGVMLLHRWLEFQGGDPRKGTGEPATRKDLHRYLFVTGSVGLVVWCIANLLGNHWLVS